MEYNVFKEIMIGMGSLFNKDYKESELALIYRFFKDFRKKDFIDAVDSCITSLDKLPTIHQLEEQCERFRVKNRLDEEYEALPPLTDEDRKEFQEIIDSFHNEKT